ncbi:26613_t:CDS:2, partial [Dentiscutata erythropus]
ASNLHKRIRAMPVNIQVEGSNTTNSSLSVLKQENNSKKQLLSNVNDDTNNNVDIFWEEEMINDEEFEDSIEEIDIDIDHVSKFDHKYINFYLQSTYIITELVMEEFFDFTIFKHNQEAVTEEELTIYSQDTSVSDNEWSVEDIINN